MESPEAERARAARAGVYARAEDARGRGEDDTRDREDLAELSEGEASPPLPSAALAAGMPRRARPAARLDGYGEIWSLSWPVMLSQVLMASVSLLDIAMVGRLGSAAIAAAGYATQFFFLAQASLFAVGFACVALMARAIGARDPEGARRALSASLLVSLGTALGIGGVIAAFPRAILGLLGATPAIVELASPYLRLLMGASALLAVSLVLESALRADRDSVTPMWVAAAATVVKVGLNLVLIFGLLGFPRLELAGAGIATVISQVTAVALLLALLLRKPATAPTALRARAFLDCGPLLRDVVRLSLPGVGERLIMNLAMLFYFSVLSAYGTVAVAVYTVGIRVLSFSWIPGSGIAAAAATLVGQSLGARDAGGARRVGWRSARMALAIAATLGALCALGRGPLASLFTSDAEIVAGLGPFLLCLALAQPAMQLHFTLAGAHRGAGDTWTPLLSAGFANWAFRVPLACLFAYVLELDVVFVWLALIADHVTRAIWLTVSFRRGAWLTRYAPGGRRGAVPAGAPGG